MQESKYQTPSKTDELVRENIILKTEAGSFKRSCLMGWENLDIVFESQFTQIFNKFFNEERFTTKSDEQV